jgi:hypothetical protein
LPHSFALALPTAYKLSGMPLASLFLVVPSLTFSVPELRRWSGAEEKRAHDDDITLLVLDFPASP